MFGSKHPKALPFLFLSEMWERFGYYLMIGIFTLYLKDTERGFGLNEAQASDLYGTFIALVFLTPFIGGLLADRILGYRKSIIIGGILMAIGLNKMRVYFMIVIETIFLALIGAPIGLAIGALNISLYMEKGVDLSNYSEGLEAFGYSSILYPYLEASVYPIVTIAVFITAIIAALYPAYKAIKLKPVEAIHSI